MINLLIKCLGENQSNRFTAWHWGAFLQSLHKKDLIRILNHVCQCFIPFSHHSRPLQTKSIDKSRLFCSKENRICNISSQSTLSVRRMFALSLLLKNGHNFSCKVLYGLSYSVLKQCRKITTSKVPFLRHDWVPTDNPF